MVWMRRLTRSVGIAVAAGATLTVATVSAAGSFGVSAGTFTFSNASANVSAFNPIDGSSINLSVDRTLFMFRSRPEGSIQTQVMTVLNINQFIPNPVPTLPPTVNSVCLVIPDPDFIESSDLETATLTVIDASNVCPSFLVPVNGAVVQGPSGGGGTGIPLPLSAAVTWTGNGVAGVSEDNGSFRCLTFVALTHDHGRQVFSSFVSGSISGVGSFAGGHSSGVFGIVSDFTSVQNVAGQGILPPACGGKGG